MRRKGKSRSVSLRFPEKIVRSWLFALGLVARRGVRLVAYVGDFRLLTVDIHVGDLCRGKKETAEENFGWSKINLSMKENIEIYCNG